MSSSSLDQRAEHVSLNVENIEPSRSCGLGRCLEFEKDARPQLRERFALCKIDSSSIYIDSINNTVWWTRRVRLELGSQSGWATCLVCLSKRSGITSCRTL